MIICWVFFLCQKLLALAANKKSSFLNFKSFDKKKDFFLHKNKEKTQKKLLMISGAKRERDYLSFKIGQTAIFLKKGQI